MSNNEKINKATQSAHVKMIEKIRKLISSKKAKNKAKIIAILLFAISLSFNGSLFDKFNVPLIQ